MPISNAGLWPPWPRCPVEDCKGIQLEVGQGGRCFAHTGTNERAAALQQLREGRPLDFTAGVPFHPELLAELLAGAPRTDQRRPLLAQANFAGASFQGTADFQHVSFQGPTRFDLARFDGDASFREASFQGTVDLNFSDVIFGGMAGFHQARFQGPTRFERARFKGAADFGEASFERTVWFSQAHFEGTAAFGEASFERAVWFTRADFGDDADFRDATFARPWEPGPMVISGALMLDRVVFTEPVALEVACGWLSCQRTRFKAGGYLRVADAVIDLQDAEVPAPLIIARHAPDPRPDPACGPLPTRHGHGAATAATDRGLAGARQCRHAHPHRPGPARLPVRRRAPPGPAAHRGTTAVRRHPARLEGRVGLAAGVALDPSAGIGRRASLAGRGAPQAGRLVSARLPAPREPTQARQARFGREPGAAGRALPAAPQGAGGHQERAGRGRLLLRRDGDAPPRRPPLLPRVVVGLAVLARLRLRAAGGAGPRHPRPRAGGRGRPLGLRWRVRPPPLRPP
jgi:hypothetical protein